MKLSTAIVAGLWEKPRRPMLEVVSHCNAYSNVVFSHQA